MTIKKKVLLFWSNLNLVTIRSGEGLGYKPATMELTIARTAEVAFPIETIMERLFYFFPEETRKSIHYKISEDGKQLIFMSDNATDEVVRLLKEACNTKHEPPPTRHSAEAKLWAIEPRMSVRLLNALNSVGQVKTLGELAAFLETQGINAIRKPRNAGKKTLDELKDFVEKHLPHLKKW